MELCSFILSLVIVGAYEGRPGTMQVQYLENETVQEIYVNTEDYLACWDNPIPVRRYGQADWRRTSTASYPRLPFNMDKEKKRRRIAAEIQDTIYAYHMYPHLALVPDWFLRYWDLAEAVCDYFDIPFRKPELTKPEEFEALKVTIDKTE